MLTCVKTVHFYILKTAIFKHYEIRGDMVTYPPYGYKCFAGFENSCDVTAKHFLGLSFLTTDHRKAPFSHVDTGMVLEIMNMMLKSDGIAL